MPITPNPTPVPASRSLHRCPARCGRRSHELTWPRRVVPGRFMAGLKSPKRLIAASASIQTMRAFIRQCVAFENLEDADTELPRRQNRGIKRPSFFYRNLVSARTFSLARHGASSDYLFSKGCSSQMIPRKTLKKNRQFEIRMNQLVNAARPMDSFDPAAQLCGISRAVPEGNYFDLAMFFVDDEFPARKRFLISAETSSIGVPRPGFFRASSARRSSSAICSGRHQDPHPLPAISFRKFTAPIRFDLPTEALLPLS